MGKICQIYKLVEKGRKKTDSADLLVVPPDLLLDSIKVGVLLRLPGDRLDEGEQVAGNGEEGKLEPAACRVGEVGGGGG